MADAGRLTAEFAGANKGAFALADHAAGRSGTPRRGVEGTQRLR